ARPATRRVNQTTERRHRTTESRHRATESRHRRVGRPAGARPLRRLTGAGRADPRAAHGGRPGSAPGHVLDSVAATPAVLAVGAGGQCARGTARLWPYSSKPSVAAMAA